MYYNNEPIISGNDWSVVTKFVKAYHNDLLNQGFHQEVAIIEDENSDDQLAATAWCYILDNFYFENEERQTRSFLQQDSYGLWAIPASAFAEC